MKSKIPSNMNGLAAMAIGLLGLGANAAWAANVNVTIQGVQAAQGPLLITLETREQFRAGGAFGASVASPEAGETNVTIAAVPPGEYAVSVWHDIDGDNVFDVDDYGRPLDGWAMSGPPVMGPPTFDSAKITVPDDGVSVVLQMNYPAE